MSNHPGLAAPHDELKMPQLVRNRFRFHLAVLAFVWLIFLAYASLLPLVFRAITIESMTSQFLGFGQSNSQLRSYTDWLTNIAIFFPLGFFGFGAIGKDTGAIRTMARMLVTLVGCVVISVGIETSQIFFPPRNSSILDVIANTLGAITGIAGWLIFGKTVDVAYQTVSTLHLAQAAAPEIAKKYLRMLGAGSILIILVWAGVFTTGWSGWGAAITKTQSIHLLPFLEHQAADFFLAIASIALTGIVYGTLGSVIWLSKSAGAASLRTKLLATIFVAMVLSLVVEGLKLFLVAKKPDIGNIIIASVSAGLGYLLAPWIAKWFVGKSIEPDAAITLSQAPKQATMRARLYGESIAALLCAVAAIALVVTFPFGHFPLALALFTYGAVLLRYPTAWLIVLPTLLPVLDLAPWTGRYFFDEFDGFVLTTLCIGLWRNAGKPLISAPRRGLWVWTAAFLASFTVSAIIGLLPLHPMDANALASPYSHFSALKIGKGLLFATGLALLLSHHVAVGLGVKRIFSTGMLFGLASATMSVIWERVAYFGLTDFSNNFRVVGLFSSMSTGGPHLDAFLITTLPFALVSVMYSRHLVTRIAAGTLFALGTYAVMMTFSRAAVASLAVVIVIVGAWAIFTRKQMASQSNVTGYKLVGSLALAVAVTAPVLFGSFMQSRLAMTGADLGTRFSNWSEAVSVMSDNWQTRLFGMGIGSYPETYQLLSLQPNKPAVHRFETEADNTYLQIGHGATFYVEQVVSPAPQSEYQISLRARAQFGDASLNVLLCDRTFLRGFGCQSVTFNLGASQGQWQQLQATLNSINVGANKLRVSKLSLENAGSGTSIDVDNIEMISSNGTNLLKNGNFQSGADRWYFSSPNNFAPWRVENLFLHVYFEQGWIGLLMFCLLVTSVISRLARLAWQGKSFALALLAGVAGFLAVGGFDSMFDAPRLILLFGLLVAASGTVYGQPAKIIVDKGPPKAPVNIQTPSTSASRQRETAVDSRLPSSLSWRKLAAAMAWKLLFLAVAIFLFTRLPFVPYNIRELPNPFHPLIAPLLLAAFIFWTFGVPGVIARWLAGAGSSGAWLPLIIVGHGLASWAMLHFAVLPESIHDVIGSPTLQWAGQTEYVARFVPLVSVLTLQIVGGALLAYSGAERRASALLWWVIATILMLPLQYWVIVDQAATDNLTELMANGASVGAFLMMALYLLLIGFVGSLLAASHLRSNLSRILIVLAVVAMSLPAGFMLVDAGTASVIVKEQKVFSALQFLLSPDRTHYAAGLTLWLRFAIAHLGLVLLIAFTQHTIWMGSHQQIVKNPP